MSIPIVMLAIVGVAVTAYAVNSRVSADRPDCPGKIVCPLTGELVCKDRCPARDANRSDCPGQIVCPVTGELICRDRCPLNKEGRTEAQDVPSCCRGGK
ncbi:MAG: hypothetical protein C4547_12055 [Phycisphaerales bacterium]|nr:MAG: hypothetical protein C4547_12055 [Phycisphaerales bacterium]